MLKRLAIKEKHEGLAENRLVKKYAILKPKFIAVACFNYRIYISIFLGVVTTLIKLYLRILVIFVLRKSLLVLRPDQLTYSVTGF